MALTAHDANNFADAQRELAGFSWCRITVVETARRCAGRRRTDGPHAKHDVRCVVANEKTFDERPTKTFLEIAAAGR